VRERGKAWEQAIDISNYKTLTPFVIPSSNPSLELFQRFVGSQEEEKDECCPTKKNMWVGLIWELIFTTK
jgi:hypothetical protein